MPSHEDILTPPEAEDAPCLDSGSDSFLPTVDSSGQSLYYLDDTGPSDDTVSTSADEAQSKVEFFLPVEDAVSLGPEVPSPLDSGVQVETAVPSPVSIPHALPELLDPPIGSEPDAASNVFVPDRIVTPKKTHLLVEAVHVPPIHTPLSDPPTPPISNDEAVAGDGGPTLDNTILLSESTHPRLQLAHPPALTLPSPTPPTQANNAPTLDIVTPLEHARRPVEAIPLQAEPVLSPSPVTRPPESKPAPRSDVAASHERTLASNPTPRQIEALQPPVQLVQAHPEPQVSAPPVTEPVPVSSPGLPSAPKIDVAAPHKLTLTSKPAPEQVEAVRPPVQPVQIHPEPKISASPAIKPAPAGSVTVPSAPVAASHKLSLTSRPQVEAVRPLVQPVQIHPGPHVSPSPVIKPAFAGSTADLSAPKSDVVASNKLTVASKPAPEPVEALRPPVQLMQIHPVTQASTSPAIKPVLASSATGPHPPVAASLKLSLSSKPEPQQVEALRLPVQPEKIQPGPQVSASLAIKPVLASSATVPHPPVAASHKLSLTSKPEPQQVEAVQLPVLPAQIHLEPQVSASPVIKPALTTGAAVSSAPKSNVPASHKPALASGSAPEQVEVVRPLAQPVQAHPRPQVSVSPVMKPAPSRSVAAPSAPDHVHPRVEPVLSPNLPARIPEAPPLHSNPATSSKAPAPDRVSTIPESARPRAEMFHRPVHPTSQPLPSSTGSRPVHAVGASTPSKTIPTPEHTRSLAAEAVRIPAQHTRLVPKSLAPVGNASAAERPILTPSGTRSQAATVPRPIQAVRPTPGSSVLPVRNGPVPASSVPSPNVIRRPPEHARPHVGAGRTSTLVPRAPPASRAPPIGITPAGSASGPDTKEVSRHRIKSHPRKMVIPVGQRRSVVAPTPMMTQPTAPPLESPPVQQLTTRLAPQNGASLPLRGMSSRMSISSPPEVPDKPKVRTTPTLAPAVPTAPSVAPPATSPGVAPSSRAGNMTSVPAPTVLERGTRISNTDGVTGRSRQPTTIPEQVTSRHAVLSSVSSPTHPEQAATSSPPSRGSSTPIARQDRASAVLPDSSSQKRANPVSIPGGWDSAESTTVTTPTPSSRATNAAAPINNATVHPPLAASNVSSTVPTSKTKDPIREPRPLTPLPEPKVPQVTTRLPAQPATPPKQQQTEPVTSSLPNGDPVATTRHGETRRTSSYRSRMETSTVVSGAETPQDEPKRYSTATAVLPRQQVGSVNIVPEPVLRSSTQRITSRIRTKDLINRHKPQPASDVRPLSIAQSVRTPTLSKSPMLDPSRSSPAKSDPNRIDSGIEIWDYSSPGGRGDRQRGSNTPAHGDKKGPSDGAAASVYPTKLPTVPESTDRRSSRLPLSRQESRMSISKFPKPSANIPSPPPSPPEQYSAGAPNTTESPQAESLASTSPGRGGGAFLSRKPQGSFQASYPETSTPPRSSTPSSMTHASTAATSTQATLVTPASSFPNLSSLGSKAQPRSWFRRNVLDPFKTKLGLAPA